jgi:acetylornithine deacetylase
MSLDPQEMIARLVATPSVSSVNPAFDQGNRGVVELLAGWLEDLGFRVELQPLPRQPHKANLIATLGNGEAGLILAGHTDTVPCDPELWQGDPWRLRDDGERLYGLGTTDTKGFFALALAAAGRFRAGVLRRPLHLVATADEESTMQGAAELLARNAPRARYALIGEPTGLRPARLHKGIAMKELRLSGRSGHSSDPSLGCNALDGMAGVLRGLMAWRQELAARYHHPGFAIPYPTLNLGHIHGGDNPNRICGECVLHFDLRPVPGMPMRELWEELRQRIGGDLSASGLRWELRDLDLELPPFETPATAPFVRLAERRSGLAAGSVPFASEAPFYQQLGADTLVLGPGDIALAHQPEEYLLKSRIRPSIELLAGLIHDACVEEAFVEDAL